MNQRALLPLALLLSLSSLTVGCAIEGGGDDAKEIVLGGGKADGAASIPLTLTPEDPDRLYYVQCTEVANCALELWLDPSATSDYHSGQIFVWQESDGLGGVYEFERAADGKIHIELLSHTGIRQLILPSTRDRGDLLHIRSSYGDDRFYVHVEADPQTPYVSLSLNLSWE